MGGFLVAVLTKVGIAIAEAIIARLVWELSMAFARSNRANMAPSF